MSADPAAVVRRVGLDAGELRLLARCGGQCVYDVPVVASEWSRAWSSLRGLAPETGLWPVVLGSYVLTEYEYEECVFDDPEDVLVEARSFDLDGWLERRKLEASEYGDPRRGSWPAEPFVNDLLTIPLGEGPEGRLSLALFPCFLPWQVGAFLREECGWLAPAVHTSLFRRSFEQWDARIVCHSCSTVEMVVGRPPKSREEALTLAREHYCYAPDTLLDRPGVHV
ncbi:MAG: DUF4253 domain-containing protein, partial [bacterium]|nr:DUF4253 domain-containing protein [bacterium]